MLYKKCAKLDELFGVAKEIINILPKSAVIFLEGDLAFGKTTLVSYIAKVLNLEGATSPTFTLEQIYGDRLFHYDFYRVDFDEILELGLIEEFEKEGLHFVEWGGEELKELLKSAGFRIFNLKIEPKQECREYILEEIDA